MYLVLCFVNLINFIIIIVISNFDWNSIAHDGKNIRLGREILTESSFKSLTFAIKYLFDQILMIKSLKITFKSSICVIKI